MSQRAASRGALYRVRAVLGFAGCVAACSTTHDDPSLTKAAPDTTIPDVPVPPADGPRLGSVSDMTPVLERPADGARRIGYLHAGSTVARAREPYSRQGCGAGWYPVRPRGFVCVDQGATLDLGHPTLAAMALGPALDQPLPYTYARARLETPLFERDPEQRDAVREIGRLKARAGMAVVGSWAARGPSGAERLALRTDGLFVRAADLQPAQPSDFHGVELDKPDDLPIAFVVKRGVRDFRLEKQRVERGALLDYHAIVRLTGRFRTVEGERYWATLEGRWVRHRDVTVVRRRSTFPDFADKDQKWIDVSVVTGTLVLFNGKQPLFATLASVNRDAPTIGGTLERLLGTFSVSGKEITLREREPNGFGEAFPVYDVPWGVDLSSGGLIYGAYWHDRFGIDHGSGSIELSPSDAARVFRFVTPELPEGFYGLGVAAPDAAKTWVVVRR